MHCIAILSLKVVCNLHDVHDYDHFRIVDMAVSVVCHSRALLLLAYALYVFLDSVRASVVYTLA